MTLLDPYRFAAAGGGGFDPDATSIGDEALGGYYAGIIDTVAGTIDVNDAYQTGARYALIVSPLSMDRATGLQFHTAGTVPADCWTRWDGLAAQQALLPDANYEGFTYCAGQSYDAGDGASEWYLPAMDELELIYRNLKPTTADNFTGSTSREFPSSAQSYGYNPSSDPQAAAYTTGDPSQTSVAVFQSGGGQALTDRYMACTYATNDNSTWVQDFGGGGLPGRQLSFGVTQTAARIRPVRRYVL